jgi:hypothetical protein
MHKWLPTKLFLPSWTSTWALLERKFRRKMLTHAAVFRAEPFAAIRTTRIANHGSPACVLPSEGLFRVAKANARRIASAALLLILGVAIAMANRASSAMAQKMKQYSQICAVEG